LRAKFFVKATGAMGNARYGQFASGYERIASVLCDELPCDMMKTILNEIHPVVAERAPFPNHCLFRFLLHRRKFLRKGTTSASWSLQ
jgi:hypothetical protein